jgi:hypothetical protein
MTNEAGDSQLQHCLQQSLAKDNHRPNEQVVTLYAESVLTP